MNIKRFKHRLLEKERELLADIARIEEEARAAGEVEVRDPIDDATASQSISEALQEGTLASRTLLEVKDALLRIEEGMYGKCLDCGRDIEPARLDAIPWAEYCLKDQERRDRAAQVQGGSTL
jgi:DnaK suppressor protein